MGFFVLLATFLHSLPSPLMGEGRDEGEGISKDYGQYYPLNKRLNG
jgi:hypothetical protein